MTIASNPPLDSKLMTAEALLQLGHSFHHEIVDGRLVGPVISESLARKSAEGRVTIEELYQLGDSFHGELSKGRLMPMSPASSRHGDIALAIGSRLRIYADDNGLGCTYAAETGFVLSRDPNTVRAPDMAFVIAARVPQGGNDEGFFPGPPDLAVEVLSPSNRSAEMTEKVAEYLNAGTRLIWIVDPSRRTVTVYDVSQQGPAVLQMTDSLSGGDLLPGFSLALSQIFK